MKTFFTAILISVLLMGLPLYAVTQLNFLVNGTPVTAINQGDTLVWQTDCAVGASVYFELWMDLNANHMLDTADVRLFRFWVTDGDTSGQEGPPDIDGMNGFITSSIGAFGFAPITWGFLAAEGPDTATGFLDVNPYPNPPATISGTVSFEDGHSPANILVTTDLDHPPFWNAVTDSSGNYTINLGNPGTYTIMPYSQNTYYVPPPPQEITATGNVTGVNFLFHIPQCVVKGDLLDEWGSPLLRPIGINILDATTQNEVSFGEFGNGHYIFGLVPGQYRFDFDQESLNPDYMSPPTWSNPDFTFSLTAGDTLTKDIIFMKTDTSIYAVVKMNGVNISSAGIMEVEANNDTAGFSRSTNDSNGLVTLRVRSGYSYRIHLNNDDIPQGYGVPGGLDREHVNPGDTVVFNLVNFTQQIRGAVVLDPGDPVPDWQNGFTVWARTGNVVINSASLNADGTFILSVPDDTLEVGMWIPPTYVFKPQIFQQVLPNDSVTFTVNYANAVVSGHIFGLDSIPLYSGVYAQSAGTWPNVYSAWTQLGSDTSYSLRVCEGNWTIFPPFVNGYQMPPSIDITVPETDTLITVDFYYVPESITKNPSGLIMSYNLGQNYPNPFNPETTIPFTLARQEHVVIEIYDVRGSKITTLMNKNMPAGHHLLKWNAGNYPSGVYLVKMSAGDFHAVKKLILMK